jgi:hypothetical protein
MNCSHRDYKGTNRMVEELGTHETINRTFLQQSELCGSYVELLEKYNAALQSACGESACNSGCVRP